MDLIKKPNSNVYRRGLVYLKVQKGGRIVIQGLKFYFGSKETGVEWLGKVLVHWGVRRLKSICFRYALYGANTTANSNSPTGVRFVRTTDITEDGQLKARGVFLSL